ncbi:MAG: hypothetical protein V3T88_07055 [Nitrosomonadaceae bacterium]
MAALDTLLATQQAPNILGAFTQGAQARQQQQLGGLQQQRAELGLQQAQQQAGRQNQLLALQQQGAAPERLQQAGFQVEANQALQFRRVLEGERADIFDRTVQKLAAAIGDQQFSGPQDPNYLALLNGLGLSDEEKAGIVNFSPDAIRALAATKGRGGLSAGQREFASLTEGLTTEQKQEAALIELGLSPRAIGSAVQTIAKEDIADLIGDTEATIGQRKKFGELTGSSRAKAIDKGFDRIVKIDLGLRNIDRAIESLKGGAKTGAIERFLPSIRAASVELEQIRSEMALDVVGATTFGALSKGELDLAKDVALPKGLDEPQLIAHLEERRDAQIKLRSYFQEQIDFIDNGGSVAGFLRQKERELGGAPQSQQTPQAQPAAGVIRFDRTGQRIQ